MAEEEEIVCPMCQKEVERTTRLDAPVQRVAERCQHGVQTYYPSFTVVWCPECALTHSECALCGEELP